ncbi:hypothetical protein BDW71DRAFT_70257 [Aspergillus fruticulosus]
MSSIPPGTDLCAIPGAQPPPGVAPNLVDPDSLQGATIAVTTVLITWATLFVAARVYTNFRQLNLADYFVVISLILSGGYNGTVLAILEYTRHQWDIPACWFNARYMKILYAQGVLLSPVIFFGKSSIFLLYRQIFTLEKPMKLAIRFGLVFTFVMYWPHVGLESYFCAPHAGEAWDELLTNGRPAKMIYWGIIQGTLAVLLDLYIFVLPLPRLWTLQRPLWKRLQIMAVFSTAMLGVIASVMALVYRIRLRTTSDTTYTQSQLFICVNVENNIAIIVSSMPAVSKFVRRNVLESAFVKSLHSKLSFSSAGYSHDAVPRLERSGSRKRPKAHDSILEEAGGGYHELGDLERQRKDSRGTSSPGSEVEGRYYAAV